MALLQRRTCATGVKAAPSPRPARALVCRAQKAETPSRRAALGALAGAAALLTSASPSLAAFGDQANIFGKVTNKSKYIPYASSEFALLLPAQWNPSHQDDFASGGLNVELRYEDNYFPVNYLTVMSKPTDKGSIDGYGDPAKFLDAYSFLLGMQAYDGKTVSEGGFAPNRVSAASILGQSVEMDKKGKKYYKYELLTRTADGTEGGMHLVISATVGAGKLYIMRVQVGDKRWFKKIDKDAFNTINSFTVA